MYWQSALRGPRFKEGTPGQGLEIAFWRSDDSASPDVEILNALRPAMASVEGSVLLALSSPYRRGGALWKQHTPHFGKDGDPVLCWQAPTRTMNPALPQEIIDELNRAVAEFTQGAPADDDRTIVLIKRLI